MNIRRFHTKTQIFVCFKKGKGWALSLRSRSLGRGSRAPAPRFPRVRVRGLTPQRCSIGTLATSNRSSRSRPELQTEAETGPAPSVTAAGANCPFQGQRGNAPSGVEVAVPDPAVPGKVRVGFLEEVTAEGATSEGGRVPGPKEGPGGESLLRAQPSNPTGAAAVPGPEGGSPGPPGSCASPRVRPGPAVEPPLQEASPGRGSFTRKRTTRPRSDGQTGREVRPTQGPRRRHRPANEGTLPDQMPSFSQGLFSILINMYIHVNIHISHGSPWLL